MTLARSITITEAGLLQGMVKYYWDMWQKRFYVLFPSLKGVR